MIRNKLTTLTISAAFLATVVATSGSSFASDTSSTFASTSKSDNFTVLFIGDTSGPTKVYGTGDLTALKAADSYINSHGGMDGRKIVTVARDDDGDGTTAVNDLLQYLASNPPPSEVFAGSESVETAPLMPVLAQHKLLSVAENDGNDELVSGSSSKFPYQFSGQAPTSLPAKVGARWFKQRGITKVGILQETIAYDAGETPNVKHAVAADGGRTVTVEFPSTATDLSPELSKLKEEGAQGIYFEGVGASIGYAVTAQSQLSWTAPILCDQACSAISLPTLAPMSKLRHTWEIVLRSTDSAIHLKGMPIFRKATAKFGGLNGGQPIELAAFVWDLQLAVSAAAKQAHSVQTPAISKAMQDLNSSAKSNPLYLNYAKMGWTASMHDNALGAISDYPILPAKPIHDGQL